MARGIDFWEPRNGPFELVFMSVFARAFAPFRQQNIG